MKKTILTVDDSQDSLEFIETILENENRVIITAQNGEQCLIKAQEKKPDLIILDVQMPKKDGFATFSELKRNPSLKDIPIIILTGIDSQLNMKFSKDDMKKFYGISPDYYLEKPINPKELATIVNKIFSS